MTLVTFLLVLALISFLLGSFNVPKYNWVAIGLALLTLSMLLGAHVLPFK